MTPRGIFGIQVVVYLFFCSFVFAVISWIVYRAYATTAMHDAGGATIAIAFVIVPIFFILFSVVSIVFWSIFRDRQRS